ncbi:MAG: TonB-dependent receptor [Saprospiraceae bacterium]|nr:TonB-dependent receptor [Saprospiraceae bacterium]
MKKIYFFLVMMIFSTTLLAQSPLEQLVSVDAKNVSLEGVLYQLIDQHNVKLIFNNKILPERNINLQLKEVALKTALEAILAGTNIGFEAVGRQVVLVVKPAPQPSKYTISGFLEDKETGEKLIGASIFDKKSRKGTVSNAYGFYSLTLNTGGVDLVFSYIGFEAIALSVDLTKDIRVNLSLESDLTLKEVMVFATDSTTVLANDVSIDVINTSDIKRLPALGGEKDILRTTHLLPGVQTGTDGVGGIYVRGGNAGQNLILIDGVPVYYIAHAVGLFSIFNTEAIRTAKLVKGGFPARYGGRISSVLDIRTKEGNMKEIKGWANLGLLTGSAGLEGPLVKNKSSFFLSGRLSYLDMYLKPYSASLKKEIGEKGETTYDFFDLNAKINYAFSDEDKLYLSFYTGGDVFLDQGDEKKYYAFENEGDPVTFQYHYGYQQSLQWDNKVAAMRWNHLFSDKLFGNTSVTYSKLAVGFEFTTLDSLFQDESEEALLHSYARGSYYTGIEDLGVHLDFDLVPSALHYVRFGFSVHNKNFRPGAVIYRDYSDSPPNTGADNPLVRAVEYNAYVEDDFVLGKWTINAGLRANVQSVIKRNYRIIEPRLSIRWQAFPKWNFKAAYSRTSQFLHLLSSSGIGLPTDLWVPSTDKIAPQTASQVVVGATVEPGKNYSLNVEAYYKIMHNLLSFSEGASLYNDWRNNVTQGKGSSYGAEFFIKKNKGKTTGWIAYTLSFTDRQFDRINFGNTYPFKYDRRHDFKIILAHRFNARFELTANWIYSTGFAYNLPLEKYNIQLSNFLQIDPAPIIDFGTKNQNRMPDYHRLDLNLNVYIPGKHSNHQLSIGVNNAYNKKNPLYYQLRRELNIEEDKVKETNKFVQVLLLPIVPSLSYSVKF